MKVFEDNDLLEISYPAGNPFMGIAMSLWLCGWTAASFLILRDYFTKPGESNLLPVLLIVGIELVVVGIALRNLFGKYYIKIDSTFIETGFKMLLPLKRKSFTLNELLEFDVVVKKPDEKAGDVTYILFQSGSLNLEFGKGLSGYEIKNAIDAISRHLKSCGITNEAKNADSLHDAKPAYYAESLDVMEELIEKKRVKDYELHKDEYDAYLQDIKKEKSISPPGSGNNIVVEKRSFMDKVSSSCSMIYIPVFAILWNMATIPMTIDVIQKGDWVGILMLIPFAAAGLFLGILACLIIYYGISSLFGKT